jgi:hypothetical protein
MTVTALRSWSGRTVTVTRGAGRSLAAGRGRRRPQPVMLPAEGICPELSDDESTHCSPSPR